MSGIRTLGYIVVQGPVEEWASFATDVLGAQVARRTADELRLRTDERSWRIAIESGPPAGPGSLVALGFEVESAGALNELAESLTANGIDVHVDDELDHHPQVRGLPAFSGGEGRQVDAYYGQEIDHGPFVSPRGVDFVTGV